MTHRHRKTIFHNGLPPLRSLCPKIQRLWTHSVELVADQVGHLPGLEVSDASSMLEADVARTVVSRGRNVVYLKDLISALSIWAQGGMYLDLDYLYIGGNALALRPSAQALSA